jgi:hypothetical protein
MSIFDDRAKSLAYWEWLRTANPFLPPFHMVKEAEMNDLAELTMTVHIVPPAEPFRFDPWEEEMRSSNLPTGPDMWSNNLCSAISNVASLMRPTGSPRILLVYAAQAIRAMAPEGTKWHDSSPSSDGYERNRLRLVMRLLIDADQYDSDVLRQDRLALAESHLHDLWLSAKEES